MRNLNPPPPLTVQNLWLSLALLPVPLRNSCSPQMMLCPPDACRPANRTATRTAAAGPLLCPLATALATALGSAFSCERRDWYEQRTTKRSSLSLSEYHVVLVARETKKKRSQSLTIDNFGSVDICLRATVWPSNPFRVCITICFFTAIAGTTTPESVVLRFCSSFSSVLVFLTKTQTPASLYILVRTASPEPAFDVNNRNLLVVKAQCLWSLKGGTNPEKRRITSTTKQALCRGEGGEAPGSPLASYEPPQINTTTQQYGTKNHTAHPEGRERRTV